MNETISIKTCLFKDLPAITTQNEEDGKLTQNCIYITKDEPAMYIDTKDNNGTWHRLRVADFPSDLWQIDHGSFAANTDYILFDTSRDDRQGRRTLKKGKLPSILTGEALNRLFEVAFPLAETTPVVGLWSGKANQTQIITSSKYAQATIKINADETRLIQLNELEYEFFVDMSQTFNSLNATAQQRLPWSYLSDIVCNIGDSAKTVTIYIRKINDQSISDSDLATLQDALQISIAHNATEVFIAQMNNRIAQVETKVNALAAAPFEFTVVESTGDMLDMSKIYILNNSADINDASNGHVYIVNEDGPVDLGSYIQAPNDIEARLQALEALGLTTKDSNGNETGQLQESFRFDNLFKLSMSPATSLDNISNSPLHCSLSHIGTTRMSIKTDTGATGIAGFNLRSTSHFWVESGDKIVFDKEYYVKIYLYGQQTTTGPENSELIAFTNWIKSTSSDSITWKEIGDPCSVAPPTNHFEDNSFTFDRSGWVRVSLSTKAAPQQNDPADFASDDFPIIQVVNDHYFADNEIAVRISGSAGPRSANQRNYWWWLARSTNSDIVLMPGTYVFRTKEKIPQDYEIILYHSDYTWTSSDTASTIDMYKASYDSMNDQGLCYGKIDRQNLIVTLKEKTALRILLRGTKQAYNDEDLYFHLQCYLLKGGGHNPLLLDRTGDEIVDAIKALTMSEQRFQDLLEIIGNPAKYIYKLGETTFEVFGNNELLAIQNKSTSTDNSEISVTPNNSGGHTLNLTWQ